MTGLIFLIAILLVVSVVWALWSLRELKTPTMRKEKEELRKGRVIFYNPSTRYACSG